MRYLPAWLLLGAPLVSFAAMPLPVVFEPNGAGFLARTGMGAVHVSAAGIRFDQVTALRFDNSSSHGPVRPEGLLPGTSNYFIGNNPAEWRTGIPHYLKVRFRSVYPGIDAIFYGSGNGKLEYDFEIAPNADASRIRMSFSGVVSVSETTAGDLRIVTEAGEIFERKPRVFQNGRELAAHYSIENTGIRFVVDPYDPNKALQIDPVIESATYLGGGSYESARALKLDHEGNVYIAGQAPSPGVFSGPFPTGSLAAVDAALIKYSPQTNTVLSYIFLGGAQDDIAYALAVDSTGAAYLAGSTRSTNFPVQSGFQMTPGGGPYPDAFVAKISPAGRSLVYSTYLGGGGGDEAYAIAVDSTGAAYVGGTTGSRNFPASAGSFQSVLTGSILSQVATGFVARVSPSGDALLSSTLLGGTRQDQVRALAFDGTGNVIAAGSTSSPDFPVPGNPVQNVLPGLVAGFVASLSPDLSQLQYASFVGGHSTTVVNALTVNAAQAIVAAGYTNSDDFPVRNAVQPNFGGGARDGFVAILAPQAVRYQFATYLGGSDTDSINDLTLESNGILTVVGGTASADFPQQAGLQQFAGSSPNQDAFVAKFQTTSNTLLFSTLVGGSGDDQAFGVAVDSSGATFIAGTTASNDFPIVQQTAYQSQFGGGNGDMFLVKLSADPSLLGLISSLNLSATVVSFTSHQGVTTPPPPESIAVSATLSGDLSFTVDWTTQSGGNWLSASPGRGAVPAVLTIFANPSGLPVGVYSGSVRVTPSNGSSPSFISVTFTVTQAAPAIQSMSPGAIATGSPDTPVTITGLNFQAGATVQLLSSDGVSLLASITPVSVVPTEIQFVLSANYLFRDASFGIRVVNPDQARSNLIGLQVGNRFPTIAANGVLNAASNLAGAVAPGEYVSISGSSLGPPLPVRVTIFGDGAGTTLGGVSVLFNNIAAPLLGVSGSQIIAVVPSALAGQRTAQIVAQYQGVTSNPVSVDIAATAPALFTLDGSGAGIGLIFNDNSASNTPTSPAAKGSIVSFYLTGAGQESPAFVDGKISVSGGNGPVAPLSVTIDGQPAEVVSIGSAVGEVAGMVRAHVRIPAAARSSTGVPIVVTAGGIVSQPNVLIAVQ